MEAVSPKQKHPILHLLQQCKTLNAFKQVHSQMITTGLILHTCPVSRVLLVSSTLATLSYTLTIFNQVSQPSIFLYNILISSLAQKDHTEVALSLYAHTVTHSDLKPNNYTYPSLFKALGSCKWFKHGQALHSHVFKFLYPCDNFVQASLLNFYSRCGKIDTARHLFNQIREPDLATWNSMLSAYAHSSSSNCLVANAGYLDADVNASHEVLNLFRRMQISSIKPNEVTLVALITACANLGAFSEGLCVHAYIITHNICLNQFIGSALLTLYANSGNIQFACQLFDLLPHKDTYCFNAMLRGFAIHGHGYEALDLFERMKQDGFVADDTTILSVMSACSYAGLLDEGRSLFESMSCKHGLEPKLEHYCCLVDLLGRSGLVNEAVEKVYAMPMEPDAVLWRSLLRAARVHGNLEIGELALMNLVKLVPETSGNYVLLSNMYASMDKLEDAKRLRKSMKDNAVDKMPGSSLVDVGGSMHEFLNGDKSHPPTEDIY